MKYFISLLLSVLCLTSCSCNIDELVENYKQANYADSEKIGLQIYEHILTCDNYSEHRKHKDFLLDVLISIEYTSALKDTTNVQTYIERIVK